MEYFDTHNAGESSSRGGLQIGLSKVTRKPSTRDDGSKACSSAGVKKAHTVKSSQPSTPPSTIPRRSHPRPLSSSRQAHTGRTLEEAQAVVQQVRRRLNGELDGERNDDASMTPRPIKPRTARTPLSAQRPRGGQARGEGRGDGGKRAGTGGVEAFPLSPEDETVWPSSGASAAPWPSSQESVLEYKSKTKGKGKGKRTGREVLGTIEETGRQTSRRSSSPDPLQLAAKPKRQTRAYVGSPARRRAPRETPPKVHAKRDQGGRKHDVLVSSSPSTANANARHTAKADATVGDTEDEGAAFFREYSTMDIREREEKFGHSQPSSILPLDVDSDHSSSSYSPASRSIPLTAEMDEMVKDLDAEGVLAGDLSAEERVFCKDYIDTNERCEYCQGFMPRQPSRRLSELRIRLEDAALEAVAQGTKLAWTRTVEFCGLHVAETTTIPLGYRKGYPREIDFGAIPRRLEEHWVREEVEEIMEDPELSSFFRKTVADIQHQGKWKWVGMDNQARKQTVNPSMPGYYGQLGRAVIMRHYENLLQWGLLPRLTTPDGVSAIAPLTPTEFISHVLVPEASIRLIQQDDGWTGRYHASTKKYTRAREAAFRMRRASVPFGRGRYSAEGEEARDVLDHLQRQDADFRARCREIRREERQARSAEVSITIISSDESEAGSRTPKKKQKTIRRHGHDDHDDDDTEEDCIEVAGPTVPTRERLVTSKASLPVYVDSSPPRPLSPSMSTSSLRPLGKTRSFKRTESGQTESSYGMDGMDGEFEQELYALGEKLEGSRSANMTAK